MASWQGGWAARPPPLLGAYSDPLAGFVLVLAAFTAFVLKGLYPAWILFLIVAMFVQFVLTSRLAGPVYDPVGKYYGVVLFSTAGLTVLVRSTAARQALLALILAFTVASVISRAIFLLRPSMQRGPDQSSPRWLHPGKTDSQNRSLRPTLSD